LRRYGVAGGTEEEVASALVEGLKKGIDYGELMDDVDVLCDILFTTINREDVARRIVPRFVRNGDAEAVKDVLRRDASAIAVVEEALSELLGECDGATSLHKIEEWLVALQPHPVSPALSAAARKTTAALALGLKSSPPHPTPGELLATLPPLSVVDAVLAANPAADVVGLTAFATEHLGLGVAEVSVHVGEVKLAAGLHGEAAFAQVNLLKGGGEFCGRAYEIVLELLEEDAWDNQWAKNDMYAPPLPSFHLPTSNTVAQVPGGAAGGERRAVDGAGRQRGDPGLPAELVEEERGEGVEAEAGGVRAREASAKNV
jgi:hypothetical protein